MKDDYQTNTQSHAATMLPRRRRIAPPFFAPHGTGVGGFSPMGHHRKPAQFLVVPARLERAAYRLGVGSNCLVTQGQKNNPLEN